MKHLIMLALTLALLTPVATPPSTAKIQKETIISGGKKRAYYLFVPDNVTAAKPAPLLVLLHGSGHNGLSQVEKWKELAEREGVIIVGPDSTDPAGWQMPEDGPDFLHDLISELESKYTVNHRRVYLFGHSAGAVFSLFMALHESEYFAAAAIHAGALRANNYEIIDMAKRKIPVAIFVGTADPFFPVPDVRATRDAMQKRGFTVQLTEIPGHDHNYYEIAPKINADAWNFLSKQELTEEPQYIQYTFTH